MYDRASITPFQGFSTSSCALNILLSNLLPLVYSLRSSIDESVFQNQSAGPIVSITVSKMDLIAVFVVMQEEEEMTVSASM